MKKRLTYDYDRMKKAASLMEGLSVTGINNFRILAEIANILDSGELSEENEDVLIKHKHGNESDFEKVKEGSKNGLQQKEVHQDQLEK